MRSIVLARIDDNSQTVAQGVKCRSNIVFEQAHLHTSATADALIPVLNMAEWLAKHSVEREAVDTPSKVAKIVVNNEYEQILISFESSMSKRYVLGWLYDVFLDKLTVEDIESIDDLEHLDMDVDWRREL
ncbi:hypothetical protein DOTSEDRAFT_37955 [Dothistroma septosporum NZE10]|uniref:Uncharacterized protein n=1 Tax=Dothistroma septosporum (strain NZE10 / CBS 128990) TaxID=675120 RepID=N1PE99_DOTSN|nr:hypothetical protein DOTSEDRAFT_37955 [Dothistroma septosporum NZE10]